jgi:hypothetical protein
LESWCWCWKLFWGNLFLESWSWFWTLILGFGVIWIWLWTLIKVLEFESWVFFLAWFTLCMSLLGLETIFEIKITIWNFGVVWKFERAIWSQFWTWSIKLGIGCQR